MFYFSLPSSSCHPAAAHLVEATFQYRDLAQDSSSIHTCCALVCLCWKKVTRLGCTTLYKWCVFNPKRDGCVTQLGLKLPAYDCTLLGFTFLGPCDDEM
jgi:hypothetical protein